MRESGRDHVDPSLFTGPPANPQRYRVAAAQLSCAVRGGEGLVFKAYDAVDDALVVLKLITDGHGLTYTRLNGGCGRSRRSRNRT